MNGAERIAAERQRQIEAEGWTPEHDDEHESGEMAYAAISYALHPYSRERFSGGKEETAGRGVPGYWPWDEEWWKPTPKDRVRELTISGALLAAEIDRLLRLQVSS